MLVVSRFLDRFDHTTMTCTMVVLAAAQVALWAFGANRSAVVALLFVFGLGYMTLAPIASHRVMMCAPGSTDVGIAMSATAFSVGIATGSALGSLLVAHLDVRTVPLVGAVIIVAALAFNLAERRIADLHPAHT